MHATAAAWAFFSGAATPALRARPDGGAAAQTPSPAPLEVIRRVGGSSIVGRVAASGHGKVHMHVDGRGDVVIDSAAVASRSSVPPPPPPPSP